MLLFDSSSGDFVCRKIEQILKLFHVVFVIFNRLITGPSEVLIIFVPAIQWRACFNLHWRNVYVALGVE